MIQGEGGSCSTKTGLCPDLQVGATIPRCRPVSVASKVAGCINLVFMAISLGGGQKTNKQKGPEPCGVRAIVGCSCVQVQRHNAPGERSMQFMADRLKNASDTAAQMCADKDVGVRANGVMKNR